MTTRFLEPFVKDYRHLHPKAQKKVDRIVGLLAANIRHPGVRAQKVIHAPDIWEARVDIHVRMTFRIEKDVLVFRRVGTHEIYRNP